MAVIAWYVSITADVVSSNPDQGKVYSIMWYSLSANYDRSVVFSGSSGFVPNKTDHHDITEILLKGMLNIIKQINKHINYDFKMYDFICSIETYDECQPPDQTFQQLNKHPEGIVILSHIELIMLLIKVPNIQ